MNAILKNGMALLICFEATSSEAQFNSKKFEIGITAGTFIYQGDLTPSKFGSFKTPSFAFSIFANRIMNASFSLRTNLSFGKLRGDDAKYSFPLWRQQRNFNFSSPVFEISEMIVWNVLEKNGGPETKNFSPYLFGGIGLSFINVRRDWSKFNAEYFSNESKVLAGLNTDIQHSLPTIIPVVPLGIGVKYSITQKISLFAESSYRLTATDYLDGFSQAANPNKKDHYTNYSIGIIYRMGINNKLDCPTLKN